MLPTLMRKVLVLNENDNIAVCLVELGIGEVIGQDGLNLTIQNLIPRGHKVATRAIAKDDGTYGPRNCRYKGWRTCSHPQCFR